MRRALASWCVAAGLAFAAGACGDDDTKKDDADSATSADATDATTTDATTTTTTDATTTTPTDATTTTAPTDTTTSEETTDATTSDGDTVEPPPTFPEFVIDLIENQTEDDTEAVPYSTFSGLQDDDTEGVFDDLFAP